MNTPAIDRFLDHDDELFGCEGDRTTLTVDVAAGTARGHIAYDDYFHGAGCFGNTEMEGYAHCLSEWRAKAAEAGVVAWTLQEDGPGRYRLVEGVSDDPFTAAFVIVRTEDGIKGAYDVWPDGYDAPAAQIKSA